MEVVECLPPPFGWSWGAGGPKHLDPELIRVQPPLPYPKAIVFFPIQHSVEVDFATPIIDGEDILGVFINPGTLNAVDHDPRLLLV